jgi:hypothetical protein
MRRLLFSAVIAVAGWIAVTPATAASLDLLGFNASNVNATPVEKVGYWKRLYRRYGYPPPYAYYLPAYRYYPPPPVYASTRLCLPTAPAGVRLFSTRVWQ